jgi:general transcription factor 3C polypeptide 3 (transcription factor C subunit 4)
MPVQVTRTRLVCLELSTPPSPTTKSLLIIVCVDYFFRAYALDPGNPMINLSIGLGYVHYGLKRQSENRQFHLMQGLSFLFRYYESRQLSLRVEERQEAHYNIARAYHMLGLAHLALPYYLKVLEEVQGLLITREDLVRDAAYNLQNIYAIGGNLEMAKYVTANWLVV